MGNKIPVDVFSPKTKAKITTIIMPIPFIPAFDNPSKKAAKPIADHCNQDKW